jgi:hypothetical protein
VETWWWILLFSKEDIGGTIECMALDDMQDPTKWNEMRRRVALIPGWPREWTWSKIGFWKERGTRGRKIGVEMLPRKERSFVMEMDLMEREDDFWREMTEGQ